jgi:hypothetical protein
VVGGSNLSWHCPGARPGQRFTADELEAVQNTSSGR